MTVGRNADKLASLKIDGLKRSMQVSPTLASGSTSFSSTVLSNQLGGIDWKAHSHTSKEKEVVSLFSQQWAMVSACSPFGSGEATGRP